MAKTTYGVNDPEAVKLWSRKLMREALKQTWASRFVGTDSNSLCQMLDDTQKGPGDRIRTILRMQLNGNGIQGDGTLEGNEEALVTYTDDIVINQLRHAVRSGGKMSDQRIPFSVREEARMGLQDWWADRFDQSFMNQLAGNSAQTDTRFTGNNAAVAADSNHRIFANGAATEAAITATAAAQFTLSLVDQAVLKARTLSPVVRPVNTEAGQKYVMFITPEQHYDLRRNTSTLEWGDIQKAAMQGGNISDNPIFTGALGEYNGVILHESFRLPVIDSTGGSKIGRAVLAGAQAACWAYGREGGNMNRMSWTEELFDYQNQLGVAAGAIFGIKKTQFNSEDFSTITVSAAHSANAVAATGRA